MKKKCTGTVTGIKEIAPDIFDMWVETILAEESKAGQFVGIYPKAESALLPRPISICEVNQMKQSIRLVFRKVGKGTDEFAKYRNGERILLLGVLGNGYPTQEAEGKEILLLGGGIGIPPIVELAKQLRGQMENAKITIAAGYRDHHTFLKEDLERYGNVLIATEDGSIGTKGNVLDAVKCNEAAPDILYACGPMVMLRAVKQYAEEKGIPAYISLEERMACGVGACLGCVCKTTNTDAHSHVKNARICTDGPVFEAGEVEI